MSYFTERAKQLGVKLPEVSVPEAGEPQPGESYFMQRARELGVNLNPQAPAQQPVGDFFTRRQMELGMIPDTRPVDPTIKAAETGLSNTMNQLRTGSINDLVPQKQAPTMAPLGTRIGNLGSSINDVVPKQATIPDNRNGVEKTLDYIFKENPVSKVLNYPFSKAAEYATPDAPYLDGGQAGGYWDGARGVWVDGYSNPRDYLKAQNKAMGIDSTGNATLDKVGDFAGQMAAPFIPVGGASTAALYNNPLTQKAASFVGSKVSNPLLNKVATEATREAITGAPLNMQYELSQGHSDPGQLALSGLTGAALGAAGGAAVPLLGAAARPLASKMGIIEQSPKFSNDVFNQAAGARNVQNVTVENGAQDYVNRYNFLNREQPLELPPSRYERIQKASEGTVLPANETPIYAQGDVKTFALPEANIAPPTRARVGTKVNPYEQKFNELMDVAKQSNMRPGYEYETVQDIWSRMAGPDDPSLDELIQLAYPKNANKLDAGSLSRARELQQQRQAYGVGMPVKGMEDRYQPFVGRAAMPETKVKLNAKVGAKTEAKPQATAQPKVEVIPPDRKFATTQPKWSKEEQQLPPQEPKRLSESMPNKHLNTLSQSPKATDEFVKGLKGSHRVLTNEETVAAANKRVSASVDDAASFVLNAKKFTAEHVATAHRLIDEFQKSGEIQRAVDLAEKTAKELTKAGQTVQAASIYNRLSTEGILVHAQRVAERTNEKLPRFVKEVKLTNDMAAQLTDLAGTVQKMAGTKSMANDVLAIMERAKAGHTLNEAETKIIQQFVRDARQFVKSVEPRVREAKAPKELGDKRVKDKVVSFLDAQEKAAKERLKAKGFRVSSTPVDVWADYAIIGAAKLAKGTIKFADWSAEMVKEMGEAIRPHLQEIYQRAQESLSTTAKKITEDTVSKAETIAEKMIADKKIEGDDAEMIRALAQKVSALSGDARNMASQDLQYVLNRLEKPGLLKKISSAQTIAQLLNPKTLLTRNPLGNELFYRLERLNKLVATPIDWTRSKITGSDRTVTFSSGDWHNFFLPTADYWSNLVKGAKAGWRGVNPDGISTQFDIGAPAFNGKWNPMTYMEKALGASLKGFDYAAYKRSVNQTLREMAHLDALNRGLKGDMKKAHMEKFLQNADENLLDIADKYGKYITLQDNNAISKGLSTFKRGLNLGKDFGVGDLIIKYPKTPGAIIMRALEYSPAGILRHAYIVAKPWLNRTAEKDTAEATLALSRAIVGTTGLTGLGWFLADQGIITGSSSKDRDIRELAQMAGQGQYQVNLSALKRWVLSGFDPSVAKIKQGDRLINYDWAQPVAIAISIGANIDQNMKEKASKGKATENIIGTAYASLEGGLNTITEQSVLKGVKDAFASAGGPNGSVGGFIKQVASGVPASFGPTVFNQTNQYIDNTKRETYDPNPVNQAINRLQVKIPVWAQQLPQAVDTLGKPKENFQNNSLFNVFLNPAFTSKYKLTPEAELVVNLINETGEGKAAPRAVDKYIMAKKDLKSPSEKMNLSPEQYVRLQTLTGQETAKQLQKINPELSNDKKLKAVMGVLTQAGDKARTQLKKELGVK